MERFSFKVSICFLASFFISSSFAADVASKNETDLLWLNNRSGFFRFDFDNLSMPKKIQDMGLLGLNYFADFTPEIYGGIGTYGSITGTQGGLFVFGFGGGVHKQFAPNWWADAGIFAGGGGGRSSLVGGGLMVRPHVGISYAWRFARIGVHYSYINFPSGLIRSKQIGLDVDVPFNFYYIPFSNVRSCPFLFKEIKLCNGMWLANQRNDFAIILQSYWQKAGTRNVLGQVQDGKISLVGAELDHYFSGNIFWWVKASGAYSGIPNGYMDILGGLGYHLPLGFISIVPQLGAGAGGGGNVDSGGGVIVQPRIGLELPLTSKFAARIDGGYLWAPKGELSAYTGTASLLYHLDIAAGSNNLVRKIADLYQAQGWRIQLFNQTYQHPQRVGWTTTSAIHLVAFQIDQFFTPLFFFSYQAASAYSGEHAGGYATGMIGPGLQSPAIFNQRLQIFTEVLVGAGGGGSLALGGGAIIEPVLGLHVAFTPAIGLQASVSQLRALRHDLNTPVFNIGLTARFGILNRIC